MRLRDSLTSRPCAAMAARVKRRGIGARTIRDRQGIHDVPLTLRHLLAFFVAHERVDVDRVEGNLVHEVQAHHHHPGDPEEDDVETRDQNVGRVMALKLGRLVGPAQRGEGPQRGREPRVEHVFVPCQLDGLAVMSLGGRPSLLFRALDEDLAIGAIPRRDLVSPPQLP